MYDENGVWQKQKVYEGRLRNGQRGLFTNRWLVTVLEEGEDAQAKAERWGMEFVSNHNVVK